MNLDYQQTDIYIIDKFVKKTQSLNNYLTFYFIIKNEYFFFIKHSLQHSRSGKALVSPGQMVGQS